MKIPSLVPRQFVLHLGTWLCLTLGHGIAGAYSPGPFQSPSSRSPSILSGPKSAQSIYKFMHTYLHSLYVSFSMYCDDNFVSPDQEPSTTWVAESRVCEQYLFQAL